MSSDTQRKKIRDYICSRSKVLENLERKFNRSIRITEVTELSEDVNEYIFKIGKDVELRITNTEDGLLLVLLELSIDRKNVCHNCDKKETNDCLKYFLQSNENLGMLEIHNKGVEEKVLCVQSVQR